MTFVRTVTSMLLGILLLPIFGVQAQLCGKSFAKIVVVDSECKSISDATSELVAELPYEVYLKFKIVVNPCSETLS
jgi:hypothetical protein